MNVFVLAIILQLAGMAVVIAEIIIPSGGLLSLVAISIFGTSLYLVFHNISITMGLAFLVGDLLVVPILLYVGLKMLARSPATLRQTLSSAAGVISQAADLEAYRGWEGQALTTLRPSGMALINGRRLDVVSRGEFIKREQSSR